MSSEESLDTSILNPIFEGVEPFGENELTRTVIGELDEHVIARIRKVSSFVLEQEMPPYKYFVDLAEPYRLKDTTVVFSSLWEVSPQAGALEMVGAERKPVEEFAVYHSSVQPPLKSREEIFDWYDSKAKKSILGATPLVIPNIFTVAGIEELVRTGNFRRGESHPIPARSQQARPKSKVSGSKPKWLKEIITKF
jgi:hypothetical protein